MFAEPTRIRSLALAAALLAMSLAPVSLVAGAADAASADEPIVGAALPGVTLPPVETREATAADEASAPAAQSATRGAEENDAWARGVPDRATLFLTPGENQIIPIAKGHLNRLITPFAHPVVRTVSRAKVKTEDSVLYVASTDTAPVTLYVSPKGRQDLSLSLTLLPRAIPPREVHLQIKGDRGKVYFSPPRAGEWEREQPYVKTIKAAMRSLALGEVPPGYGMQPWQEGDPVVRCTQPGLRVKAGQMLPGAGMMLIVATARNASRERIEIHEANCRREGVLAVAAWPHASLAPGEQTELYVVVRRAPEANEARTRPSLLDTPAQEIRHGE